eukprot:6509874-Heterocapsa_arctica.AAC.1
MERLVVIEITCRPRSLDPRSRLWVGEVFNAGARVRVRVLTLFPGALDPRSSSPGVWCSAGARSG